MEKFLSYKLLNAGDPDTMAEEVQKHINEGWVPHGSPFVAVADEKDPLFCQAVVKTEP